MGIINAIRDIFPDANGDITIHWVDCCCYSVFEVIEVSGYRWNIIAIFYISPQEQITNGEVWGPRKPSKITRSWAPSHQSIAVALFHLKKLEPSSTDGAVIHLVKNEVMRICLHLWWNEELVLNHIEISLSCNGEEKGIISSFSSHSTLVRQKIKVDCE